MLAVDKYLRLNRRQRNRFGDNEFQSGFERHSSKDGQEAEAWNQAIRDLESTYNDVEPEK